VAKIIQILFDDAGWGDFPGRVENSNDITPAVDTIREEACYFSRFYVASPVCSSSRVAWVTGKLPQYSDVHFVDSPNQDYRAWLPVESLTDAQILRAIGYNTAHFGKWHMGTPPQTCMPHNMGNDRFFGGVTGNSNVMFAPWDYYQNAHQIDDDPPAGAYTGLSDDVVFGKVLDWIDTVYADNFYAKIWVNTPHEPGLEVSPENALFTGMTTAAKRYLSMMRRLDAKIGELKTKLQDVGIWDSTYLFISSDNGPEPISGSFPSSYGSTGGLRGSKTHLWEGGLRVPLIIKGPGITANSTDNEIRWSLDYLPTLLEIVGATVTLSPVLPGSSLLQSAPSRNLTWEYNLKNLGGRERPNPAGHKAVLRTSDDYKLHATGALYNITSDPNETTDVAGSEPALAAELQAIMDAFVPPAEGNNHVIATANPATEAEALEIVEGTNPAYGLEPARPRGRMVFASGEGIEVTV
jgi:arylsulfatase A-like enzyme